MFRDLLVTSVLCNAGAFAEHSCRFDFKQCSGCSALSSVYSGRREPGTSEIQIGFCKNFFFLTGQCFLRWLVGDILFRDHFLCFEFTNRHEISSLHWTRNFEFANTKFPAYKLEISSLQTQNFEFVNSKQRKWSRNRMSLTSHRSFPFTVKAAKTFFSQIFIPHPSKVNLSAPILASSADNSSWYFRQRIQAAKTGSEEFEWVGERRSHVDFCHSLLYPH